MRAYDPAANANATREVPDIATFDSAAEAFRGADAVIVGTEWAEFRDLPFGELRETMRAALIFDGRRMLDAEALRRAGYDVVVLGDGRGTA